VKVVHLLPALEQGGVERVVCDLNRALTRAGWESVVVSRGGRLESVIAEDGGRAVRLDLKSKNPLTYFPRVWKLRALLRRERPDLVCVHSRVPAWLFVGANRTLGLKWISYAHGANSVSRYSAVMTRGDLTVAPSQFLADFLKTSYGLDASRLRVIPNAVDATRFDPANLDAAFIAEKRRAWGLEPGVPVVMSVGRITPIKGFDALIRETPADRKLVIVGGADRHHLAYERKLKAMAGPNVVFAGAQTKIPECLSLADEVVSGNVTKPESFGLSVIEAYAMNRPVRAKRFGGVGEVMAAVEAQLAAGAASYREAVLALYDFDIMSHKTLSVYKELVR